MTMNEAIPVAKFEHDYRKGFDFLTESLKRSGLLKDYEFKELTMPDGEIQRWWVGHGEELIVTYKKLDSQQSLTK